jgi:DUF4097 and DUF4098 domain-containing protein YvlB
MSEHLGPDPAAGPPSPVSAPIGTHRTQEGTPMHEFPVTGPVRLRVEFGAGDIAIKAADTDRVSVDLRGDGDSADALAAETVIEQRGDEVLVEVPRRTGFLRRSPQLSLTVTLPEGSRVDVRSESADLDATGRLGDTQVKAGSGDTRVEHANDLTVQSGSGDVAVGTTDGFAALTAGSGDVTARQITGPGRVSTGSGDIRVERADGPLQANSGSGDVQVDAAEGDVNANTASGDQYVSRIARGRVKLNSASGDISVGVVDGTPVWLDVNTLSGSVASALSGGEPPVDGEDAVELRVNTVSGDISLARS